MNIPSREDRMKHLAGVFSDAPEGAEEPFVGIAPEDMPEHPSGIAPAKPAPEQGA